VEPARWQELFDQVMGRVAGRFARVEPRRRARAFVGGLLADLPRKNCWTIAEHASDPNPDGMQHLLARAVWDHDGVRDDLRDYAVEHLSDPEAVLVVDETGDLKKGTATVGVQRQYTGTAGRIENAQVAVSLVYASRAGHAVVDRELYLPQSWTDDPDRLRAAGVPNQVGFATKPALAKAMLGRALDADVPAAWVTATRSTAPTPPCGPDSGPAASAMCRRWPATTRSGSVAPTCAPTPCSPGSRPGHGSRCRAAPAPKATATTTGRSSAWTTTLGLGLASSTASTGCWSAATSGPASWPSTAAGCPTRCPLAILVRVAGTRWTVQKRFQTGKGLCGLDQHQLRRWRSWYRWVTLAMLAHAFLVVAAVTERSRRPPPSGLIPLTCNEIQHLFATLVTRPAGDLGHWLRWSAWRRRHQARARTCHDRRQAA
jgi:SRSO17 transposase